MFSLVKAVTRPHYNLSRATAAVLVAHNAAESRSVVGTASTTTTSKPGKLEAALTAVVPTKAAAPPIPSPSEHPLQHPPDPDEAATEDAVCGAFEADAVFPRPSVDGEGEEEEEEDVDEEVDEYLEDGDDPDDASMGDENAMLRRAHESALLKAAAEAREKSMTTTTNANGTPPPPAAAEPVERKSVDTVQKPTEEIPLLPATEEPAFSEEPQDGCDSPPPIVAHVSHIKKTKHVFGVYFSLTRVCPLGYIGAKSSPCDDF